MSQPEPGSAAETYEQYFVPAMFVPWANILLRHASPQPGERVLDVACGTGIVARLAAPLVGSKGQVVAVDVNPAMLAVAGAHPAPSGVTIQWQKGNAAALPFPDGTFDVVLCQHGLQFIPDRASAVREMRRVLVPGGRALAIVLQALARHPVFEALIESVARSLAAGVRRHDPVCLVRCRRNASPVHDGRIREGGRLSRIGYGPVSRTGALCSACFHELGGGGAGLHPTGDASPEGTSRDCVCRSRADRPKVS